MFFNLIKKLILSVTNFLNETIMKKKPTLKTNENVINNIHYDYLDDIDKALKDWKAALSNYDFVADQDLIDYFIYKISAAEERYMYLLKKAKKENITNEYIENILCRHEVDL